MARGSKHYRAAKGKNGPGPSAGDGIGGPPASRVLKENRRAHGQESNAEEAAGCPDRVLAAGRKLCVTHAELVSFRYRVPESVSHRLAGSCCDSCRFTAQNTTSRGVAAYLRSDFTCTHRVTVG